MYHICSYTHSLPAIEAPLSDKPHNSKLERLTGGSEKTRKSVDAIPDLFTLEQKIGQMHEAFSAICGNVENIVEAHVRGDTISKNRTNQEPMIDEMKTLGNEERKEWEKERAELCRKIQEQDAEILSYRCRETHMAGSVTAMRKRFDAALERINQAFEKHKAAEKGDESLVCVIDLE